jgi:hypothetical protein
MVPRVVCERRGSVSTRDEHVSSVRIGSKIKGIGGKEQRVVATPSAKECAERHGRRQVARPCSHCPASSCADTQTLRPERDDASALRGLHSISGISGAARHQRCPTHQRCGDARTAGAGDGGGTERYVVERQNHRGSRWIACVRER